MQVAQLSLQNYKNLTGAIDLPPGFSVIIAPNGSGKSNLLESIIYLGRGSSFRGLEDEAVQPVGAPQVGISSVLAKVVDQTNHTQELGLTWQWPNARKTYIRNGKRSNLSSLKKNLSVFIHAPQDIDLIAGAAGLRRSFLDETLAYMQPNIQTVFSKYRRVLARKNALLSRGEFTSVQSEFWIDQQVNLGAVIAQQRLHLLIALSPIVFDTAQQVFNLDITELSLQYKSKYIENQAGLALPEIKESLQNLIYSNLNKEIAAGRSLYGPQRDDVSVRVNNKDIKTMGSRGQQRLISLVLHLSTLNLLIGENSIRPIVLLDDILSELDQAHRQLTMTYLFELSKEHGLQIILTCPDSKLLPRSSKGGKKINKLELVNYFDS